MPRGDKEAMKKYPLSLPSPIEQKGIAHILGSLDDKIELNRQMNETLEAMAQALFKSWFVDFDPVIDNALKAGNAITDSLKQRAAERAEQRRNTKQRKTGGVDSKEALDQLFPDAFEYTEEMGWIPLGWGISDAGTEYNTVGGATPSTKNPDFWEDGNISWTTPKDLSGNQSKILLNTNRKITELGLKKVSSGLLPIDTVLMSSRAPVGYLALAKVPVAINQGYIALKCEKTLTPEFAIQWADSIMDEIKQRAGGTTFAEISKKSFREIPLFVPDQNAIKRYSENVRDLYNQKTSQLKNIETLTKLRDTLLPKLLSGELRIPDAEKLIEEAI
jgi:type I restriction enzyme S subunit